MRHLFVTNDFPPKTGGIETYLLGLCAGLDPADVGVVAPRREGWKDVDAGLPFRVFRLPGSYLRGTRAVGRGIAEAARDHGPDVVHFLHALPLGRLAASIRDQVRVPVTVFAHGSEVFVPGRIPLAGRLVRRVLRSADRVVAVSEYTAAAVDRLTNGRATLAIVPPSVDVERFSLAVSGAKVRQRHRLGSRFTVVFVSRLVKRKGAEILVRAVARTPGVSALIVGSGPEEATVRRLATELEAEDRVHFAGRVPDAELAAHYAAGDVFCMPCSDRFGGLDTEGFGIVYIEAAACGLPVVAGACGGAVEAVRDGETGYVLEDPTPESVGAVLRELRHDGALRASLGAAGRAWAERFTPTRQAARLERVCEDLLR